MGLKNDYNMLNIRDFGVLSSGDIKSRAKQFSAYTKESEEMKYLTYFTKSQSNIGSRITLSIPEIGLQTKEYINFASNDYLGFSSCQETIEAGIAALSEYGTGCCAASIIGGYTELHRALETSIASFLGYEDALICSSGFGINEGALQTLMGKQDIAFIDTAIHASALSGLHTTNTKYIGHNDPDYLDFVLKRFNARYRTRLVIIDGVYSQEGDLAKLPEIIEIVKKHGAYLMVDDAHGIGVLGEHGRGTLSHYAIHGQGNVDILTGTLSKSFGTVGGFVCASGELISYLRYFVPNSVFSAAPTPQATASALKALEIMDKDSTRQKRLWENIGLFKKALLKQNISFGATESAIFPLRPKNREKYIKETSSELLREGFFAPGILYPAVKENDPRIRAGILATHTEEDILNFADALNRIL